MGVITRYRAVVHHERTIYIEAAVIEDVAIRFEEAGSLIKNLDWQYMAWSAGPPFALFIFIAL